MTNDALAFVGRINALGLPTAANQRRYGFRKSKRSQGRNHMGTGRAIHRRDPRTKERC